MENKVYGENHVIKGQISFDGICCGEPYDFCFSVANAPKETVDMMMSESVDCNSELYPANLKDSNTEDTAGNFLKRSAIGALCCANPLMISTIMEDILRQATDYDCHDLEIGDYISACVADEDEEEFTLYNYLEIESFEYFWNEYEMIERKIYSKELTANDINKIKQIASFLYNCGYHELDTDLVTIESVSLEEDSSAKAQSGILSWLD